jgi:outer membrane protein assembly factor BamB
MVPLHPRAACPRMKPAYLNALESRMSRRAWLPAVLVVMFASAALAANWPQWRGPTGDGVCSEPSLPLKWSETENMAWKCPLPDGASTPVIWGNAVFATGQDRDKLMLFRIDRDEGKIVWSRQVGAGRFQAVPEARRGKPQLNPLYSLAAPSPVTDGEVVVAHYGNGDLAAYDYSGKQLWKHNLQTEHGPYTSWWGHANSPVLVDDLVISVCMQDSLADLPNKNQVDSYLVAHDKRTGVQRWKTMRNTGAPEEKADSYTTPLLRTVDGRRELVVMGGNQLDAYDPITGKQIWYLPGLDGGRTVTGPTIGNGLIFATRGKTAPLVAVRAGGAGKLGPESIVWTHEKDTADSSTVVYHDGLLFWIRDKGVLNCVDAATGKPQWDDLPRLSGDFKASPIVGAGRVYFLNIAGRCTVLAAAAKYEKLADNSISDATVASLAAADGRLYIRGRNWLYCIK